MWLRARDASPNFYAVADKFESYGNCLALWQYKENSLAIRPKGPYRNILAASHISFPGHKRQRPSHSCALELNGPIRQLVRSGEEALNQQTYNLSEMISNTLNDVFGGSESVCPPNESDTAWFLTRTPCDCSVIRLSLNNDSCVKNQKEENPPEIPKLEEICRIDLRESLDRKQKGSSMLPIWCSGYCGNNFVNDALFVIATTHKRGSCIHRVAIDKDSVRVHEHPFNSVSFLKQVEYTLHPMRVWASGTPYHGFGEVVHHLDLRQSSGAVRVWSPSHAEFRADGMCSVQSMLQHPTKDHTLFAASSMGKLYQLDIRMPMKEVCSWTLPALADPPRFAGNHCMLQYCHDQPDTLLSVEVAPETGTLRMYQAPNLEERKFHAPHLEMGPSKNSSGGFIARSLVFDLADSAQNLFFCGLACMNVETRLLFRDDCALERLNKGTLCVWTLTSLGDMHVTTLLKDAQCLLDETSPAVAFNGLPVGSAAIAVPSWALTPQGNVFDDTVLEYSLTNEYPARRDAFLPFMPKESVRGHVEVSFEKEPREADLATEPYQDFIHLEGGLAPHVTLNGVEKSYPIPVKHRPAAPTREFPSCMDEVDTVDTTNLVSEVIYNLSDAWDNG